MNEIPILLAKVCAIQQRLASIGRASIRRNIPKERRRAYISSLEKSAEELNRLLK